MSYQEREIPKDKLLRYLEVLDSDEGIRIDNKTELVFINKTAGRYCINISRGGFDEFFYNASPHGVLNFLKDKIGPTSKIFLY